VRAPGLAPLVLSLAACGAPARPPGAEAGAATSCRARLEPWSPTLAPPPALSVPGSRFGVTASLAADALRRALDARIGRQLGRATGQDAGAAGKVSVVVTRGDFELTTRDEHVIVTTPVQAAIEVCKPVGPFCPVYGRCSPRFSARVSVPLVLDQGYRIGKSRVDLATTRGCVLDPIGLDVTPEVERRARQQIGGVAARVDASAPELRPWVEPLWRLFDVPIATGATGCLRVRPRALRHGRPSSSEGVLALRVAALGDVVAEEPCSDRHGEITRLPAPELDPELAEGIDVELPVRIAWSDVSTELTRAVLGRRDGDLAIERVRARGASSEAGPALALAVTLAGATCGEAWLLAEPWFDDAAGRVRLRGARAAPGAPAGRDAERMARLLEASATVRVPIDVEGAPRRLRDLTAALERVLEGAVAIETTTLPARVERVAVTEDALVPIVSLRGHAQARVRVERETRPRMTEP
jgi:hypothetical protein